MDFVCLLGCYKLSKTLNLKSRFMLETQTMETQYYADIIFTNHP